MNTNLPGNLVEEVGVPSLGDVTSHEARASLEWLQEFIEERFGRETKAPVRDDWDAGQLMKTAGTLPNSGRGLSATLRFFKSEMLLACCDGTTRASRPISQRAVLFLPLSLRRWSRLTTATQC